MRELNTQELASVTGAGKTAAPSPASQLAAIKALLSSKGISIALDKVAHTVTITTPKGSKTFPLPSAPTLPTMPAAPAPAEETADA